MVFKRFFLLLGLISLSSCVSIRVASDYDQNVDFSKFKTYAFYKAGIDKVEISDLDKRRILRAIEKAMISKGFTSSDSPDLLINISTTARERVDVDPWGFNYGFGWGWGPWNWGMNYNNVYTRTEGTLYIDFVDATKKELIWQGKGIGNLPTSAKNRDEKINEFVSEILEIYPPSKG